MAAWEVLMWWGLGRMGARRGCEFVWWEVGMSEERQGREWAVGGEAEEEGARLWAGWVFRVVFRPHLQTSSICRRSGCRAARPRTSDAPLPQGRAG